MPKPSLIVMHPLRVQIETGLLSGGNVPELSSLYGVPVSSLYAHRAVLRDQEKARAEAHKLESPEGQLEALRVLATEARLARDDATTVGARAAAIDAERRALQALVDATARHRPITVTDAEVPAIVHTMNDLITEADSAEVERITNLLRKHSAPAELIRQLERMKARKALEEKSE